MTEPAEHRRLLFTGGRHRRDRNRIHGVLEELLQRGPFTAVHGACRKGADEIVSKWAQAHAHLGVREEKHPADWSGPCDASCEPGHRRTRDDGSTYCPDAGTRRNNTMVATRPDECHAFPGIRSSGTWQCVRAAEKAGIPVDLH